MNNMQSILMQIKISGSKWVANGSLKTNGLLTIVRNADGSTHAM